MNKQLRNAILVALGDAGPQRAPVAQAQEPDVALADRLRSTVGELEAQGPMPPLIQIEGLKR